MGLAPSAADQLRVPGSLVFDADAGAALVLIETALQLDPAFAPAWAARGNLLLRRGKTEDARAAYERAVRLDPDDAASRYALAELAYLARDEAAAQTSFDAAFARERLFSPPAPRAGTRHALVLGVAGPWPRNMPLDFVVDDRRWTLHRWFLPDAQAATRALPPVELVVNACGESVAARAAIDDAQRIVARLGLPAINQPARSRGLARDRFAATVAHVAGVHVPAARRLSAHALAAADAGVAFPLLVRPVDAHGGHGLERLDDRAALAGYLARAGTVEVDRTPYVDYRSADGWYRKYRIMFVDGVPYPYHLAIDERWMIHYYRTGTAATPWMSEEEAAFLTAPERALAGWRDALPALGTALGLDYVGIDCAQLPDGTLLVFEADSAMLVHAFDASGGGRLKRAAVERIRAALGALFERRAAGG